MTTGNFIATMGCSHHQGLRIESRHLGFEAGADWITYIVMRQTLAGELGLRQGAVQGAFLDPLKYINPQVKGGAEGRTRTGTGLPPLVFETSASTCSATPAGTPVILSGSPHRMGYAVDLRDDQRITHPFLVGTSVLSQGAPNSDSRTSSFCSKASSSSAEGVNSR